MVFSINIDNIGLNIDKIDHISNIGPNIDRYYRANIVSGT